MPENARKVPGARVYLVAQPTISRSPGSRGGPNVEPLYDHGQVVTLIQSGDAPVFHPERCMRLIEERLEDFDPDTDMFAFAGGDTLALFMTGVVVADMAAHPEDGFTEVTWLRYERGIDREGNRTHEGAKYVPVRVPLQPKAQQSVPPKAAAGGR